MDRQTPASWLNLIDAALRAVDTEIAALESAAADLRAELARPLPEVRLPGVIAPTAPQPMARAAVVPPARPAAPAPAPDLAPWEQVEDTRHTLSGGYAAGRRAQGGAARAAVAGLAGQSADPDADFLPLEDPEAAADLNALGQWGAPTVLGDDAAPVITMAADEAADAAPAVVRKPASRIAAWTSA